MRRDGRRLAHRGDEVLVHMVDLDRGQPKAPETRKGAGLSDQSGEVVRVRAIAIAPQIHPGEHDLLMAVLDPSAVLSKDGCGRAASRGATHLGNDAEGAREAAAVLDLHESAHPVEANIG